MENVLKKEGLPAAEDSFTQQQRKQKKRNATGPTNVILALYCRMAIRLVLY